jgi:hypothetical protein
MIRLNNAKHAALVVALAGSLLTAAQARGNPITYSISQGGWSTGGTVTGSFSGEDLNHDGFINLASGEVASYQITFSGNAIIPSFTHTLSDLQFFTYTVGSSGFPPSFPLFSLGSGYFYDADDHVIGVPDLSAFTVTREDALVTSVPESSTAAMIAVGLVGLAAASRRRTRSW